MDNKTNFLELFNIINKINVYGDENIEFEFSYNETSKNLLTNNTNLFETDTILIDDDTFELCDIPEYGNKITIYTHPNLLKKAKVFFSINMDDLYKDFILSKKSVINTSINKIAIYLVCDNSSKGAALYTYNQLPPKVNYILENKFILNYLKTLADYDMGDNLLFLSQNLIKLNIDLNLQDITPVSNYSYIKELQINKNEETKRIFISILYKKLNSVEYNKRLKFFFQYFDEIMNEYKINSQIYYSDFDIYKIHNYLDKTWLEINQKIKKSIINLKGEVFLIISGGLSVTKLDFGNNHLGVYGLIVLLIIFLIGAIIYSSFFKVDINELNYINNTLIKNHEEYINKLNNKENINIKEILGQIEDQKHTVKNKLKLLKACRKISYLPVLFIIIELIKTIWLVSYPSPLSVLILC